MEKKHSRQPSRTDVLFSSVVAVKKPTLVQVANLPPVFPQKSPLQLVAKPLRHGNALLAKLVRDL